MGKFIFKGKTKIEEGVTLEEAAYSTIEDGYMWQWDYEESDSENKNIAKPGIYSLKVENHEIVLSPTKFNLNKHILSDYVHTQAITGQIDKFFSKLHVYEKYGVFPKRGILMHGPQGTGKSLTLSKACEKYVANGDTVVVYWPTDKLRASYVKDFLKELEYNDKCKKLILVVEDIGGVSVDTGGQKLQVEPSLLSILDNVESVFKIPTLIIATTNFPENLLQNIANRPKRFDYLHEVGNPDGKARAKFLKFFSQDSASDEECNALLDKKYNLFSVAHIEEVVIRAELNEISIKESIEQVYNQSKIAANSFIEEKKGLGII